MAISPLFVLAASSSALAHEAAPPPVTAEGSSLTVSYPHGSARTLEPGEQWTWAVHMSQTLQPSGPHEAPALESSMDLRITETVEAVEQELATVTIEVTEAQAFGFQSEEEERAAQGRRLTTTVGPGGVSIPSDEEAIYFFGTPNSMRMVDIAVRSHVLHPVLPAEPGGTEEMATDRALIPSGWSPLAHHVVGTTEIGPAEQRLGVPTVNLSATRVAETLVLLPAIDNPVETFEGNEPDLNDFFLATLFRALVPEGTDPHSLLPEFPLQVGRLPDHEHRRRPPRRPRARMGKMKMLCCVALLASACTVNPKVAEGVTSVRLTGPLEMHTTALVHETSGILIQAHTEAQAGLSGTTVRPNDEALPDLGPLAELTGQDVGLEATWTLDQSLIGDLPEEGVAYGWGLAGGLALLAAAGIALVVRRGRQSDALIGA